MGKFYKGQTALKLTTETCVSIKDAISVKLAYKKPSGIIGEFIPTNIVSEDNGVFEWEPADANDLNEIGEWIFWADIQFFGGKKAQGEPYSVKVFKKGT